MRAELIVARELLRCRLAKSGRDALLERVAELLDAACRGTPPFCSLTTPQVVAEARARPRRAHAPPGASGDPTTPMQALAQAVLPRQHHHQEGQVLAAHHEDA